MCYACHCGIKSDIKYITCANIDGCSDRICSDCAKTGINYCKRCYERDTVIAKSVEKFKEQLERIKEKLERLTELQTIHDKAYSKTK